MSHPLHRLAAFSRFALMVAQSGVRRPLYLTESVRQVSLTSHRSLIPVTAVVIPLGMVIALQGLEIFQYFGAQRMLSALVSVAVLRELAPVLASTLVAAQSGSACAAELGAMRIREELDATAVMAVSGLKLHVVPRVVGLTLACPLLYVVGSAGGLIGGYLTAVMMKGEPAGTYLNNLFELATPLDLLWGLVKTSIFGLSIGLIACWQGYYVSGGAAGVGRAVNATVVQCVVTFVVLNYVLTTLLYRVAG